MIKLKQRITNPMTVIAIFATLSETSAAISLPFLDNEEREIYIWFLISFPFYLLFLFFATLNFNYRSLYAPSDFAKDKHFLKVMDNTEHSDNTHEAQTGRGLEANTLIPASVRLPRDRKDLRIIDARRASKKVECHALLEQIRLEKGEPAEIVVFLIAAKSETLLKQSVLKYFQNENRRSSNVPFCIAYNLNSRNMTVIDHV